MKKIWKKILNWLNNKTEEDKPKLVVAEKGGVSSSLHRYHLRIVGVEGVKIGGLSEQFKALCGETLNWDTNVGLDVYGKKNVERTIWCEDCANQAKLLK